MAEGVVLTWNDATGWTAQAPTGGVTGTGTANVLPEWTSGTALGDSQVVDNGTSVGIGNAGTFQTAGKLEVAKSYTNTQDANLVLTGSLPLFNIRNGSHQFVWASNYAASNVLSLLAGASSSAPTTQILQISDSGDITMLGAQLLLSSGRMNAAGVLHSFGASSAPSDVDFYVVVWGGQRLRFQASSGLSYTDFFTPNSGSNRTTLSPRRISTQAILCFWLLQRLAARPAR